jgi:hypothetical protein
MDCDKGNVAVLKRVCAFLLRLSEQLDAESVKEQDHSDSWCKQNTALRISAATTTAPPQLHNRVHFQCELYS